MNQQFGFIAEKLFTDDKEAENSPRQEFGAAYGGGDIKYLDVNGDGRITNADQVPLGFLACAGDYIWCRFRSGYKQWDISAFFQGAGNQSFWIDPVATAPFKRDGDVGGNNNTQLLKAYADSQLV